MSAKSTNLYFVALVPPEPIHSEVMRMKEEVAERFGSKAALRSPPHITLHMPFDYRVDREQRIFEVLQRVAENHSSFIVDQKGFGCFEPRVIFVDVQHSELLGLVRSSLIRTLRLELNLLNADYKDHPFHPHMTIAFRDLKKAIFQEAWAYFKDKAYQANWKCREISLLKHDGKRWGEHQTFPFDTKN